MASLLNMNGGSLLKKGLPYDAEIEYLESDGSAFIDTDIILTNSHVIDIEFTHISSNRLVGGRNSNIESFGIYGVYVDINANGQMYDGRLIMNLTEGTRYKVHAENGNRQLMDVNGNILQQNTFVTRGFNTIYKTPIFALRWNSVTPSPAVGRIHSISIANNGYKLIDFIPVRIGTTGYMYDKVSGQLFGNAGTGNFILGLDKTI